MVRRLAPIALFLVAIVAAAPADATGRVDVALVLAVDSSGSIDDEEFHLQREGYARALMHPEVLRLIRRGPYGAIAVTFVEWSGPEINTRVLDWTRIAGEKDASGAAARIIAMPRTIFGGDTALGGAIELGMALLAHGP